MPVDVSAAERRRSCEKRHLDSISFLHSSVITDTSTNNSGLQYACHHIININVKHTHTHTRVCKRSSGWIKYNNYIHITQPDAKNVPNCDVSFANGELHHMITLHWRWVRDQGGQLYEQRRGSLQPANDLWPYFGHALIINITWSYAWWSLPLANETSQLGIFSRIWLCNMNIVITHTHTPSCTHSRTRSHTRAHTF